eukprot:scaffold15671_cov111-Isochrysis_galbana.AAC.3
MLHANPKTRCVPTLLQSHPPRNARLRPSLHDKTHPALLDRGPRCKVDTPPRLIGYGGAVPSL